MPTHSFPSKWRQCSPFVAGAFNGVSSFSDKVEGCELLSSSVDMQDGDGEINPKACSKDVSKSGESWLVDEMDEGGLRPYASPS